jgi:hypothetical protein
VCSVTSMSVGRDAPTDTPRSGFAPTSDLLPVPPPVGLNPVRKAFLAETSVEKLTHPVGTVIQDLGPIIGPYAVREFPNVDTE